MKNLYNLFFVILVCFCKPVTSSDAKPLGNFARAFLEQPEENRNFLENRKKEQEKKEKQRIEEDVKQLIEFQVAQKRFASIQEQIKQQKIQNNSNRHHVSYSPSYCPSNDPAVIFMQKDLLYPISNSDSSLYPIKKYENTSILLSMVAVSTKEESTSSTKSLHEILGLVGQVEKN